MQTLMLFWHQQGSSWTGLTVRLKRLQNDPSDIGGNAESASLAGESEPVKPGKGKSADSALHMIEIEDDMMVDEMMVDDRCEDDSDMAV